MRYTTLTFGLPESTGACLLSTAQWSSWTLADRKFTRVAYLPSPPTTVAALGTTAAWVGDFVVERIDSTDFPKVFNYNAYAHIRTSDGHLLGPPRQAAFTSHHSSVASSYFDRFGTLTSQS